MGFEGMPPPEPPQEETPQYEEAALNIDPAEPTKPFEDDELNSRNIQQQAVRAYETYQQSETPVLEVSVQKEGIPKEINITGQDEEAKEKAATMEHAHEVVQQAKEKYEKGETSTIDIRISGNEQDKEEKEDAIKIAEMFPDIDPEAYDMARAEREKAQAEEYAHRYDNIFDEGGAAAGFTPEKRAALIGLLDQLQEDNLAYRSNARFAEEIAHQDASDFEYIIEHPELFTAAQKMAETISSETDRRYDVSFDLLNPRTLEALESPEERKAFYEYHNIIGWDPSTESLWQGALEKHYPGFDLLPPGQKLAAVKSFKENFPDLVPVNVLTEKSL